MSATDRDSWRRIASDFELDLGMLEWAQGVVRSSADQTDNEVLETRLSKVTMWSPEQAAEFVRRSRALPLPDVGFA